MDILSRLIEAAGKGHNDGDLPLEIVAEVQMLISQPAGLAGKEALIETLIVLIEDYDPYAGVGCFGSGSSLVDIRKALQALK
jgi:hypothetical protein